MKKGLIVGLIVLSLLVSSVLADQIKLSVSPLSDNLKVNDEFNIVVSYKPEGITQITSLRFDVTDLPRVGNDVDSDGVKFVSATSSEILKEVGKVNPGYVLDSRVTGDGYWYYGERSRESKAIGCSSDQFGDECVGTINQFNDILTIKAKVTAIPKKGKIEINFDNLKVFEFITGRNVVFDEGDIIFENNQLSFARTCGDGFIAIPDDDNFIEECDPNDLAGATCVSRGFASGDLACDASCNYDTSDCVGGGIIGENSQMNLDLNNDEVLDSTDITWINDHKDDFWTNVIEKDYNKLHNFIKDLVAHFNE
jgi:hypothetical protein